MPQLYCGPCWTSSRQRTPATWDIEGDLFCDAHKGSLGYDASEGKRLGRADAIASAAPAPPKSWEEFKERKAEQNAAVAEGAFSSDPEASPGSFGPAIKKAFLPKPRLPITALQLFHVEQSRFPKRKATRWRNEHAQYLAARSGSIQPTGQAAAASIITCRRRPDSPASTMSALSRAAKRNFALTIAVAFASSIRRAPANRTGARSLSPTPPQQS
jgi:hypothetical protein